MSSFRKSMFSKGEVEAAEAGPLYLVARRDSYTLSFRNVHWPLKDVPAQNLKEAKRLVVEAARKKLAEWSIELDRLAEEVK